MSCNLISTDIQLPKYKTDDHDLNTLLNCQIWSTNWFEDAHVEEGYLIEIVLNI